MQQQESWNVTTIGYNTKGATQTLDDLMADEQVLLIDTRLKPWSQRPEWRQEALAAKYGSRYHWAGRYLGNLAYKTGGEIQIADPDTGLRGLRMYLSERYRLVLLCGCAQYSACHRRIICEMLCATTPGVRVMQPDLPSEGGNVYMQKEWAPQEGKIPCLSVAQPFATGIIEGKKSIELRTWGTSYRGIIALHAGSKWYNGVDLSKSTFRAEQWQIDAIREAVQRLGTSREVADYPTGAIVGIARLVQCRRFSSEAEYESLRPAHKGSEQWDERDYGWHFIDVVRLKEPMKVSGRLGLFGVDREPLEYALSQFAGA